MNNELEHDRPLEQAAADENYIERLFPKCPPKQQMYTPSMRHSQSANSLASRSNGLQQQQQQHQATNYQASQQRRQNRHTVHQHSRRELEARRQRSKQQHAASNLRRHQAAVGGRSRGGDSSDSSGNEATTTTNSRLKRSATSSSVPANTNELHQQYSNTAATTAATANGCGGGGGGDASIIKTTNENDQTNAPFSQAGLVYGKRKSSKYTASQNLLQHLQRSQSGHALGQSAAAAPLPTNIHQLGGSDMVKGTTNSITSTSSQQVTKEERGNIFNGKLGAKFSLDNDNQTNGGATTTIAATTARGKPNERHVNRTSRGVVFGSDNLAPMVELPSHSFSQSTLAETTNLSLASAEGDEQSSSASALGGGVGGGTQPREQPPLHQPPPLTESPPPSLSQVSADHTEQTSEFEGAKSATINLHPSATLESSQHHLNPINEQQRQQQDQLDQEPYVEKRPSLDKQSIESPLSGGKEQDKAEDDKYINLFVYDNNIPQQQVESQIRVPTKTLHCSKLDSDDCQEVLHFSNSSNLSEQNPHIVSIANHQASQQLLLVADGETNDENGEGIIRNDTSIDELCNINEENLNDELETSIIVGNKIVSGNEINDNHSSNELNKLTDLECSPTASLISGANSICSSTSGSSTSNSGNTSSGSSGTDSIGHNSIKSTSLYHHHSQSHHHHHNRSLGTLQPVDERAEINIGDTFDQGKEETPQQQIEPTTDKIDLIDVCDATLQAEGQAMNPMRKGFVPPGFPQRIRPTTATTHRAEHEISQPARRDETTSPVSQLDQSRTVASDKINSLQGTASVKRPDHAPQMPCIREARFEGGELESSQNAKPNESHEETEKNLASALNKLSLAISGPPAQEQAQPVSNLRHHKLPNESSHYSIVKPQPQVVQTQARNAGGQLNNEPIRSSSIQFNTLSDGESDNEGHSNLPTSQANLNKTLIMSTTRKSDLPSGSNRCADEGSIMGANSKIIDDDLAPTTKTALIFPRLDEGLSSEAESCNEEVEDDDDRAMEADVDADDDDDDDEDDEDDVDVPGLSIETRASHSLQSGPDNFSRQPHQQQQQQNHQQLLQQLSKPQNRTIGTLQQHQQHLQSNSSIQPDQCQDVIQIKSSGTILNNYISNEALDLKSIPGYSQQNGANSGNGGGGSQSNYWMGVPSQSQQTMSSQSSSNQQQQFSTQKSLHNNNSNNNNNGNTGTSNNNMVNGPRVGTMNSYIRDDVKSTCRLSSDTDNETDRLLGSQRSDQLQKLANTDTMGGGGGISAADMQPVSKQQNAGPREVQIEGVMFDVKYLGSTHTDCEGRGEKEDRIHQAEMAVHEVKFRNGESQTATDVKLFISTEKIMVLNSNHQKIMMDHSLRTISYIADIGDAIVLIVRKKGASHDSSHEMGRPISKISCHVFESTESHTITKSISQAFQVAYTELLKANGASDGGYLPRELDYQEVLNSQEMSTAELEMFARKDNQREVIVPKQMGEILGLSIVESGWGSVLPTAVIASLKQEGPAYRCKKLSVGDQILSINGISLVGLSLAECQEILRKTKNQRVARLSVVPCPITVEVKIKRPDTKYQLGFSVQNGVICSLLRGGIAERGGVRVGHRIMSINGTTVVGVPHDKIVTLLASSVGEIRMKTCLTSLYRHMLGEEKAVFL